MEAEIDTGNHPPISEPLRRHAKANLDLIDQTVAVYRPLGWSRKVAVLGRRTWSLSTNQGGHRV